MAIFSLCNNRNPREPKKRVDTLVVTRRDKPSAAEAHDPGEGRAETASVLSLIFWLLSEWWGEAEDVVSKSTSL